METKTENGKNTDLAKLGQWSNEQVQLIKDTVAKGTTNDELKLFFYIANKYQLDPLIRQVWCVKYGSAPATIFTARDGFLSIAHRSKLFNGMKTEREFDADGKIVSATCTVYKKEMEHPIEVTVYIQEYNTGKSNWAKMPITMLCKVAESQALRKAFDISGIYAEEEAGAIQETQTAVENGVENLSDEIYSQIYQANTREHLSEIWNNNKGIQKKTFFIAAIKKRGEEINNRTEPVEQYPGEEFHAVAAPLFEVPDAVINDILTIETIKDLNAYIDSNPQFKGNKIFSDAVNKQKIAIGKKLQKGVPA